MTTFGYYLSAMAEESPCHYYDALANCSSMSQPALTTMPSADDLHADQRRRTAFSFDSPEHYYAASAEAVTPSSNADEEERLARFYDALIDDQRKPERDEVHAPLTEADMQPLPTTLLTAHYDARPVVVSEIRHPFRIVAVNVAWEGLCCYTAEEAIGRTLGELLHGPETDAKALSNMMEEVMTGGGESGYESSAVVTNYTKYGRSFQNRVKVGCILEGGKATHYVGVLREIS